MKNTPDADQAAYFKHCVAKWQQVLHLGDWRIEQGARTSTKRVMAMVEFDDGARLATYRFGDWGGEQITIESLDTTALHELLHVLLHDLVATASDPHASDEKLDAAEHRVINVLERVIYQGQQ